MAQDDATMPPEDGQNADPGIKPLAVPDVPELEDAPTTETQDNSAPIPLALDPSRYLTEDEFHQRMSVIYRISGQSPPVVMKLLTGTPRPALQSLVHAGDMDGARQAHNALYQTIAEVPWLHFLLARQSGLLARLAIIGAFGFVLGSKIAEEISATWRDPIVVDNPPQPEKAAA
ncbi:MAG TPA: hypothetical protein VGG48_19125 [Rhizomicrobium sp.]|jgi:hypothetical protein